METSARLVVSIEILPYSSKMKCSESRTSYPRSQGGGGGGVVALLYYPSFSPSYSMHKLQRNGTNTVPQVFRVDFLCFLVFFVCSESYFLQYSSEKSQSWQECRQVTPHHNCMVKIY